MIINFSVENWMSFRDQTSFSMLASRERQHRERVPKVKKYSTSILPIASIYGGNASGKSNFFKALECIKELVVDGTETDNSIPVEPYLLDSISTNNPSRFKIELLIDEIIYEFSCTLTQEEILDEKLVQITRSSEKILYDRKGQDIEFGESLLKKEKEEEIGFLKFAFRGTRKNQLFLQNSVSLNADHFRPVYDWFEDTLLLVTPEAEFGSFGAFLDEKNPLYTSMKDILSDLDTGISHLIGKEFRLETLPERLKIAMEKKLTADGDSLSLDIGKEQITFSKKGGKIVAQKMKTIHLGSNGKEFEFEMQQESDGTQRVIHLLPAFIIASTSKKVLVIDEIDRSLHYLMTRSLIERYLASCSHDSRSQLLMTTHDLLLMDQDIFRRDEMWITERDSEGCSELIAFSDYKEIRYDKDIRRSYLQGRLGGIPNILTRGAMIKQKEEATADQEEHD